MIRGVGGILLSFESHCSIEESWLVDAYSVVRDWNVIQRMLGRNRRQSFAEWIHDAVCKEKTKDYVVHDECTCNLTDDVVVSFYCMSMMWNKQSNESINCISHQSDQISTDARKDRRWPPLSESAPASFTFKGKWRPDTKMADNDLAKSKARVSPCMLGKN